MSLLNPNPAIEPEPEAPVEDAAEDEVVDEVEQPEELPADEPQSDPQAEHKDLMDKEVQKLQQLRATYEREIAALQQAPTERQVERVEKAKTKLDKYLESTDVDPYQGVADIAEEVMADRGKVEQLLQQFEAQARAAEERAIRQEAELAQMRFTVDYPELRGQYSAIQQKAHDSLAEKLGTTINTIDAESYVALVNAEFIDIAKREAEAAAAPAPPAPKPEIKDTAKKPKATNLVKSKSGAKVATPQDSDARGEELLQQLSQDMFGMGG